MAIGTDWIDSLKSDDEALALMSFLGFSYRDWPFIRKVGGALRLLASDLMRGMLAQKALANAYLLGRGTDLRAAFDRFYAQGGFLVSPGSEPSSRLFRWEQAPLVFFGRNHRKVMNCLPAVAIVGSRQASGDALIMTKELSACLAKRSVTVVSGGASGIDQAAHLGALAAGGSTVVVSGMACDLACDGVVARWPLPDGAPVAALYPFGPFIPQAKFMFVERNRYVAALADALVVVQGSPGSGTLHTASFARELKVPIFAVPGRPGDSLSFVPNRLLAAGLARAVVDFSQFADALVTKSDNAPKKLPKEPKESTAKPPCRAELPYLLQVISDHENALAFDELLSLTGKSFADLQKELLDYELSGLIFKRGSQFVLTGN